MEVRCVELGSADYQATLDLRQAVLLEPFGIALEDARCVACLLLIDRGGGSWQLRQMAVTPELQRQGIGQKLVAFALSWAREAGAVSLMAHAREPAVGFYERAGFSVEGEPYVKVGLPHRTVVMAL